MTTESVSNPELEREGGAAIVTALKDEFGEKILDDSCHHNQCAVYVNREIASGILRHLRDEHEFHVLVDVTAVDFLNKDQLERFQVVYVLQQRFAPFLYFRVNAWVPEDDPKITSVFDLWRSAKWGERECHDMFGIVFDGNPDLRRFLMPEDYPGSRTPP